MLGSLVEQQAAPQTSDLKKTGGWLRNYTTRKALRRLDHERLDDLGLTAEQASVESRKWFWQD